MNQNSALSETGNRMSLVVVGINHRTAPVDVRERVVFDPARVPDALRELASLDEIEEAVIVSTCNRTELYCVTECGEAELGDWLQNYHQLGSSIRHCLYHHDDMRAVSHVFAVASGLDSMVLGEPQILGQLKDAYRAAQEAGTTGPAAQPPLPGRVLGREAGAHRDRDRRQRRVGGLGRRGDGQDRVRELREPHRADGRAPARRSRSRRATCTPTACAA